MADERQHQKHCEATRPNAFRLGRRNFESRSSLGPTIRECCKKNCNGGKDPPADTVQTPNLQELQELHPARGQLSRASKAAERTARRDYLFQLWETDANSHFKKERKPRAVSKVTVAKKGHVKSRLAQGRPTVCVGKNGASQDAIDEIEKQLKRKEMVKVRILKSALANEEAKQVAMKIAEQTEASLVEVRGHTFMLYKLDKK